MCVSLRTFHRWGDLVFIIGDHDNFNSWMITLNSIFPCWKRYDIPSTGWEIFFPYRKLINMGKLMGNNWEISYFPDWWRLSVFL